ncbi:14433_t:CDS:2, partial [Entrophospora sp. SA101]
SQHRTPMWFKELEQKIFLSNDGSRLIQAQYVYPISHFKGSQVLMLPLNNRAKDWIVLWNFNNSTPVIGKIQEKDNSNNTILIQHWYVNNTLSLVDAPFAFYHGSFIRQRIHYSINIIVQQQQQDNLLIRFIEDGPLLTQLLSFQQTLQHSNNLEFYTDGSLVGLGTIQMSMSFAILQTALNAPRISFSATIEKWPSSTRAE